MKTLITVLLSTLISGSLSANEYHVGKNGNDNNPGTKSEPLLTISAAAHVAQPGDTITVHEGTYRERVAPPRGGSSDSKRIVYRAASGERALIKGSEIVKGWKKVQNGTWSVTLPNSFFGDFNPYRNLLHGDWFHAKGRRHHTGAVYLDGYWLSEAAQLDDVMKPASEHPVWFCESNGQNTTIWAQFPGVDPNEHLVEINVRQTVFYPKTTGINYITVRGMILEHAATPWAPPTAEQIGLIGTNWSKGWVIERNTIRYSMCVGVTLGKHGDVWDNTSQNSAEGYVETIKRALANHWNKQTIGHHIVRKNTISHCEQAGIVGSMGCVFSRVTDNDIFDIWTKRQFTGAEIAGIKFHGAIDTLIAGNRIHNAGRGIWMDWMTQGTRLSHNLCYDNTTEDLFLEVNHGPFLVDNNIFLSPTAIRNMSEGGAYVHNLIGGKVTCRPELNRETPYLVAHATQVKGLSKTQGGDDRFYNNIFVGPGGLTPYNKVRRPCFIEGNIYLNGASPSNIDKNFVYLPDADPQLQLVNDRDRSKLTLTWNAAWNSKSSKLVTTDLLGTTAVGLQSYVNSDNSKLSINVDYFGEPRDDTAPGAGPFADLRRGALTCVVWP